MQKFFALCRAVVRQFMRYSTAILAVATLGVGSYVWWDWPRSYFQLYCAEAMAGRVESASQYFPKNYDNSYDCDQAVIHEMKSGQGSCRVAGCRLIYQ